MLRHGDIASSAEPRSSEEVARGLPEKIDSGARLPFHLRMADAPQITPARRIEQAARDERLARALRENLRRRKEQARAREPDAAELPGKAAGGDEPPP